MGRPTGFFPATFSHPPSSKKHQGAKGTKQIERSMCANPVLGFAICSWLQQVSCLVDPQVISGPTTRALLYFPSRIHGTGLLAI